MILVEPLAHVAPDDRDALTDVDPAATKFANPGVEENVRNDVSPEVQVALLVTSLLLLSVALN